MVIGLWNKTRFYCLNHKNPVPLITGIGTHPVYVCAESLPKSEENPDGYTTLPCGCKITYNDAVNLVDKLSTQIETNVFDRAESNYTGMRFSYRKVNAKVIKHTDKHIDIGILPGVQ